MVRFGLIGTGSWGREHARAIRQEGAQLAYVVGTQAHPPEDFPLGDAPYYTSFDLSQLPPVDVVDIVVPNHLHALFAKAALHAGYHVLLEKPMATTWAEAAELVQLSRSRQRILAVGYEMRFSPLWQHTRNLIQSPSFGTLQWIDLVLERHPFRSGRSEWRLNPDLVGNWVIEEAVHHLDLICWLAGLTAPPVEISAQFPGSPPPLADLLNLSLTFPSGGLATYRAALNVEGHHLILRAYGTGGSVSTEWHGATDRTREPKMSVAWRRPGESTPSVVAEDSGEVFEINREIRAVMAAIEEGQPLWLSAEEALYNLGLAEAVERAATSGRVLRYAPEPIR